MIINDDYGKVCEEAIGAYFMTFAWRGWLKPRKSSEVMLSPVGIRPKCFRYLKHI